MSERIQKILSQWGVASRRHAEELILDGKVRLNGKVVKLGDKADPNRDRLEVDGKRIEPLDRPKFVYFLINKPNDVISTCQDPEQRKTVIDLLPPHLRQGKGIHPVGRLDRNSTGALILTNDGELTLRLTHPRYHLPKTYDVWIAGHPTEKQLDQWEKGIILEDKKTLPAKVEVVDYDRTRTCLEVTLTEGRNRQIRRVAEEFGFEVLKLHRRAIGEIKLNLPQDRLGSGQYRALKPSEISFLKRHVHLQTQPQNLTFKTFKSKR